ncbi:ATP-dependent helicase [Gudongella sp. SC589]|jgi:DNA helicase-2/ATP-dependent DNA helicase PcrA|uniref:ATP-dependent helicase n=1 Tax=Gudongella sp. SC589 TaxID=3385990 RepID=UPI0039046D2B
MILSKTQMDAINHKDGPALILAVPGSGKTTVIIHRVNKLINDHGVKPERILSITFSKASAMDMNRRYSKTFSQEDSRPDFSTIHAFCFRIIKDYSRKKKITYRLIEDDRESINKYRIIKDIYKSLYSSVITEEKLEAFLSYYGYAKNMMIAPDALGKTKRIEASEFTQMFKLYEDAKYKNRLLDFDDLLTMSHRLLVENPKALDYYRRKYDYIQLDEGQDTSRIQLELLKLMAAPRNNIFIVADDDQSIYGFRGAYPQGLLDFNSSYPEGKVFYMEINYRSSRNIVKLSNSFIKQNRSRYVKNVSTENPYNKAVQVMKFRTVEDQYSYILKQISKSPQNKAAVLYRNNLSALGLMNYLEKNNRQFYMRDVKLKFFNHWLVKDIYAFMELASDGSSVEVFEQIFYKMKGYISRKMIDWLKVRTIERNVFKELLKYPGISEFYRKKLLELEIDFKKLQKMTPAKALRYIRIHLNYDSYIHENSLRFGYTFEQLKEMLYHMELIAAQTGNYPQFKERMNSLKELMVQSSNNWCNLTLSTVHSAKGLEFDNVFIIDLVNRSFPSAASIEAMEEGDPSLLEEERRLFYVGMTRAKASLDLMFYETLDDKNTEASGFLSELEMITKEG